MPANNDPIFSKQGDQSTNGTTGMAALVTAAAADYTGISANYQLVFTAEALNGGFLRGIIAKAGGTNVQTVARVFLNNGATNATATNNEFIEELTLPATTASNTSATPTIYIPINRAITPGFRVYVGIATAVAAGWAFSPDGGKY